MNDNNEIPEIKIHDPLAAYLGGPATVENFSITLMDAARLAGHLCPSVAGAFLVTRAAVLALFPETKVCERGMIAIDLRGGETEGVNGPIGHVMSYITGAWPGHGFAGIQGNFVRKNLMQYDSTRIKKGHFRFERIDTGKVVEVSYFPNLVPSTKPVSASFGEKWQNRVKEIISSPDVIEVFEIE